MRLLAVALLSATLLMPITADNVCIVCWLRIHVKVAVLFHFFIAHMPFLFRGVQGCVLVVGLVSEWLMPNTTSSVGEFVRCRACCAAIALLNGLSRCLARLARRARGS